MATSSGTVGPEETTVGQTSTEPTIQQASPGDTPTAQPKSGNDGKRPPAQPQRGSSLPTMLPLAAIVVLALLVLALGVALIIVLMVVRRR